MKFDKNKAPIALIPPEALTEIANVFAFGAEKYAINDWRRDANNTNWSRTYSSIQRHLMLFWQGEDIDPESGMSHVAHAATQIMILLVQLQEGKDADDRFSNEV
jgi:hypothetical protein